MRAKADVVKIDMDAEEADISICPTSGARLIIEHTKNIKTQYTERDGMVTFSRLKKRLLSIKTPRITIYVPECNVPSLTLKLTKGTVTVNHVMLNDAYIYGDNLKVNITGASLENIAVKAKELDITADDITVKNLANAIADGGRVEIDNSFCKKTECRLKNGNIGVSCSTCEYTVLDAGGGTVTADMVGNEKDYTIELDGASVIGEENIAESGKSFKARSTAGSVLVNFTPDGGAQLSENGQENTEKEHITV